MHLHLFSLLAFVAGVGAKNDEVCFPIGSFVPTVDLPQLSQGYPEKIGPHGPPGLPRKIGEPGPPGRIACNQNEIEQLWEENRLQDSKCKQINGSIKSLLARNSKEALILELLEFLFSIYN